MIGWKIECEIDKKTVVAEVVSVPLSDTGEYGYIGAVLLVFYEGHVHQVRFHRKDKIKVIDRK